MDQYKIINAWICQVGKNSIVPQFGDLTVSEGRITDIRVRKYPEMAIADRHTIDAGGRVVLPPFVNFHDHIYSRLAKGMPVKGPMENFTAILDQLWWTLDRALDAEMINACAQLAAVESLQNGVTYIFDHHASPHATEGSLDIIASILNDHGLRAVLCFETSDRNGHLSAQKALAENNRFLSRNQNDDVKGTVGLHALFTLEDATLAAAQKIVSDLSAAIHIHLAEDRYDAEFSQKQHGISPAARLKKFDLLSERAILAHGIHLSAEDYDLIKNYGAALVYNPDSNLNNAVGLPQYKNVPDSIPILAGTDGMHANIRKSQKQLFLLYRMQGNTFEESFTWFEKIWFDQFNFIRKWFGDYPALQISDRADLVVLDYFPPAPVSAENFWGHYIYGMLESPVHSVFQKGKRLLEQGRVINSDYDQLRAGVYKQGKRLYHIMEQAVQ